MKLQKLNLACCLLLGDMGLLFHGGPLCNELSKYKVAKFRFVFSQIDMHTHGVWASMGVRVAYSCCI